MTDQIRASELPALADFDDIVTNSAGITARVARGAFEDLIVGTGALADELASIRGQVVSGLLAPATWVELSGITGSTDAAGAEVPLTDGGTHSQATATGYDGDTVDNSGRYSWDASWSRWVRIGPLGNAGTSVILTAGGTADAITGTSDRAFSAAAFAANFVLPIAATNTGAVTVAIDGGTARALVSSAGNALVAGDLVAGMYVEFRFDGTSYRLLTGASESRLDAAVASAEAAETSAAADATQTAADRVQTGLDRTAAAASADTAQAAAEASGDVLFYDTKATADTALSGMTEGQVVEVFADEGRGGLRTRYRVESSAFVFKLYLDARTTIHVDSENGDDADPGILPGMAKATLSAAVAAMSTGDTLLIARGSRFYGALTGLPDYATVRTYGVGPRPIIDGSREITTAFTDDGSNTYRVDVTHATALSPTGSIEANIPWLQVWIEAPQFGAEGDPLTPYFAGADIAANIAYVKANPGTFTAHQVGSTNKDPRVDTSGTKTEYRYYVHLADSSDPDAAGTAVYYGEAGQIMSVTEGVNVDGIVLQRCITKDMSGSGTSTTGGGHLTNCEWIDPAVHGFVGYATGANNRLTSRMASAREYGGGWHNFYPTSTKGVSPAARLENSYIEGFAHGIYSHGSAGETGAIHDGGTFRNLTIRDCGNAINLSKTTDGIVCDRIDAKDTLSFVTAKGGEVVIRNSRWLSSETSDDMEAFSMASDLLVENTMVIFRGTGERDIAVNGAALSASDATLFYELTMNNCTVVNGGWTRNSFEQQVNLTATNSILGNVAILPGVGSNNTNRTMTLTNCQLKYDGKTLAEIQAIFTGVGSDCVVPHVLQTAKQTIASVDITWRDTTRTGGATSGDATLTTNANIAAVQGQGVRILDYDGAGGTWTTTIASITSSTEYELTDAPDATFAGKAIETAYAANVYWSSAAAVTTTTIAYDGTTVTPADASWMDAGTYLYLTGLGRAEPLGVVQVASKSAGVLTLEDAVSWSKTGGMNAAVPLPSFNVQYQFPTARETALINIDRSGGAGVGDVTDLAETTDGRGRFDDVAYRRLSDLTNESGGGQIQNDLGQIDLAIPVGEGDVVTITSTAYIAEFAPVWASDPATSGVAMLPPGHILAAAGMGATP